MNVLLYIAFAALAAMTCSASTNDEAKPNGGATAHEREETTQEKPRGQLARPNGDHRTSMTVQTEPEQRQANQGHDADRKGARTTAAGLWRLIRDFGAILVTMVMACWTIGHTLISRRKNKTVERYDRTNAAMDVLFASEPVTRVLNLEDDRDEKLKNDEVCFEYERTVVKPMLGFLERFSAQANPTANGGEGFYSLEMIARVAGDTIPSLRCDRYAKRTVAEARKRDGPTVYIEIDTLVYGLEQIAKIPRTAERKGRQRHHRRIRKSMAKRLTDAGVI